MKALNGKAERRRPRPRRVTEEIAAEQLEELQAREFDHEEGIELAAKFAAERLHLEVQHNDRVRALELQHQAALARLDARQARALLALYEKQGRTIGPGLRRLAEGGFDGT